MADPITFERVDVSMSANLGESRARPRADTPFTILIMGDFSGRANRGAETDGSDIHQRKLYRVDRDNDEAVMEELGVSICLPAGAGQAPPMELAFTEIDDFHPEQIYSRTSIFKALKKNRRELLDPDTATEALARFSTPSSAGSRDAESGSTQTPAVSPSEFAKETTAGLLEQVLDASVSDPSDSGRPSPQTDWDRFLGDIVSPHLVPDIGDQQEAMVAALDKTISESMRSILHHPDFKSVESAWRALRFCLRRLETDERLTVYLLDVTQSELASDLTAHEEIRDTAIYRKLSSSALGPGGGPPWAVLAGLYSFAARRKDAITLARLGAVGQILGAPFVGAGDAGLANCSSLAATPDPSDWNMAIDPDAEKAWQVIRTLPEAGWVGLAMPRFLIRLPYGEKTDPVDAFDFEEMTEPVEHEAYLWACPVFAVIQVLGNTFTRSGWSWSRGLANAVDDLPIALVDDGGEKTIKPCAEIYLSERALDILVAKGLMPLVAFTDGGRMKLARFQSIADPPTRLNGSWTW